MQRFLFAGLLALATLPLPDALADESLRARLVAAAAGGDAGSVRELIAEGAAPNSEDERHRVPLLAAVRGGHLEVVRLLLEHGADPALSDGDGRTPLMIATAKGHLAVIEILARAAEPH